MKTQALSPFKALVASLALLLAANGLLADAVTEAAVKKMATGWLKTSASVNGVQMGRSISRVQAIPDASGNTLYYAVQLSPEGFLLVAADDQLSPVICFSKGGQYTVDKVPPLTDLVTGESTAKLNTLKKFRMSKTLNAKTASLLSANQSAWSFFTAQASAIVRTTASGNTRNTYYVDTNNTYVPPLVKSKWNQSTIAGEACYNYYTPSTWAEPDAAYPPYDSMDPATILTPDNYPTPYPVTWTDGLATNFVSGCVSTAVAQLVRHHKYPTAGIGNNTFNIFVSRTSAMGDKDHLWRQPVNTRGGYGGGEAYDYTKMPLVPNASISVEERRMIGSLLFDCGVSAGSIKYATNETGAIIPNWGLFSYTGIKDDCTLAEVRANLDAQYPLYVTLSSDYYTDLKPEGHAVLCDGYVWYPSGQSTTYTEGNWYFHMNMGWGGDEDAWYNADGIYAQVWDFSSVTFTGNIYPARDESAFGNLVAATDRIISGRVVDSTGYPIQGVTVTVASTLVPANTDTTTTDSKGIYAFVLPQPATYTLTPAKNGYTFTPTVSAPVALGGINLPDNDFSGVTTPTVATKGVFNVTATTAEFVGGLVATGGPAVTARGFCWGTAANPTIAGAFHADAATTIGIFTYTLPAATLATGTVYHVRAYATNTQGTSYGGDFTFKTN